MKISNSKKELARIISENGGWLCGFFAVMCRDGTVISSENKPFYDVRHGWCCRGGFGDIRFVSDVIAKGWCHTILSREEYFHLHPVTDAVPKPVAEAKPTIEQLAADYRNAKDYAERKQKEADEAKADAEVKLADLVAAGKELGLSVSPITAKQ